MAHPSSLLCFRQCPARDSLRSLQVDRLALSITMAPVTQLREHGRAQQENSLFRATPMLPDIEFGFDGLKLTY
jgi:hypothetical protein